MPCAGHPTIRDIEEEAGACAIRSAEFGHETKEAPRPSTGARVLFLINGFRIDGGAETAVASMVSGLNDAGLEVHLADIMGGGPLPSLTNLPIDRIASFDLRGRYGDLRGIYSFYRYVREQRFDIVHTHLEPANTIGMFASKLAGVPYVLPTVHSLQLHRTWRRRWINRVIFRCSTRTIVVSRILGEHLANNEGCPPEKIVHIPNSINMERLTATAGADRAVLRAELRLPVDSPIVAHVGSMLPKKKQEDLLVAFAQVLEEHPDALLLMVGDGPRRSELERIARRVAPLEVIRFLGVRRDAHRILAASEVSALSSVQEGLPLVVIESFAVGTPVVATDVAGLAELVDHGRTGVLVPAEEPERLGREISDLLGDAPRRARIAKAAREFATRTHDLPVLVDSYLDLFDDLIT